MILYYSTLPLNCTYTFRMIDLTRQTTELTDKLKTNYSNKINGGGRTQTRDPPSSTILTILNFRERREKSMIFIIMKLVLHYYKIESYIATAKGNYLKQKIIIRTKLSNNNNS